MSASLVARRDRRTLIAGVSVVALLFGTKQLVPKWMGWQQAQASAAASAASELADARSAVVGDRMMRDSLTARRAALAVFDSALLRAASVPIASVVAAEAVAEIAGHAGLVVAARQVAADSASAGKQYRVSVRITASGNAEALAAFLKELIASDRLFAVRELNLSQSDPTAAANVESLRLDIVVDALCLIDTSVRS